MATGNLTTLAKNVKLFVPGMLKMATEASGAFATYMKMKNRQWALAPQEVKDQAEMWDEGYWKRHLSQDKNMWVDKELHKEVSQPEIAKYHTYRMDIYKTIVLEWPFLFFGGLALPWAAVTLGNDTWVPSTFAQTAEQKAEWRKAQDLIRYKYAGAMLTDLRWFLEFHIKIHDGYLPYWDALWEKNDVPRDNGGLMGGYLHNMYNQFQPFHLLRRKQARAICRCMGIPCPGFGKINFQTRIRDYWDIAWNEDYMVITQKLADGMSDEQLYDYAWRRYLAPYDQNLNRAELLRRVKDYHNFLGKRFVDEGHAPNIYMTIAYVMGNYNEPAYLDMDIAELDKDDFEHLSSWGKDAFLQRLEFENGPLRDQVEAHSVKKLAEREKLLSS